jgi:hypothetical protein
MVIGARVGSAKVGDAVIVGVAVVVGVLLAIGGLGVVVAIAGVDTVQVPHAASIATRINTPLQAQGII